MHRLPRIHQVAFLPLACLAMVFVSCEQSTTDPDGPPRTRNSEILPLALGNRWITLNETFDSTGILLNTFTDTATVVGDTTVDGEQWFYFLPGSRSRICNRAEGLYSYMPGWSPDPFLQLKYPGQAGQTYSIPYALGSMMIVATDTVVTIAPGTYTCYQYRTVFPDNWVYDYFYSAGVGIVGSKGVWRSQHGDVLQTTRRTLLSFIVR